MGGQVLSGGVIVFVAVALWLVYLLPSWQSRHRFTSAERNAVRLNQALRVLAETAEAPREVQLELTARTAHQQQKLARQVQADKARTELAAAKARLEVARLESARDRDLVKEQRVAAVQLARAERAAAVDIARAERAAAVEVAQAERAAALEKTHAEKIAALERAHAERQVVAPRPEARRARARRRFRLVVGAVAALGLASIATGLVQVIGGGMPLLLGAGVVTVVASLAVLRRAAVVAARGATRPVEVAVTRAVAAELQDVPLAPTPRPTWTPRELPRPLVASAGSRAAAVVEAQIAREALRAAAREEAAREIAAEQAPTPIESVRPAAAAPSPYSAMGYVDDTEIEDHVRRLLERRASGQ
ncbi:large exoprotein [Microbacterium sp. VKM Ac-2923]|uniref:large exoprotein n=1 Tax=Microbacterium sp. VKM Ac-2923 TaxID=2929476 RepID=UPI001FB3B8B9|nr:large exoprotein [Microbacterium sp. VKM Ac-2923]MCJ1707139.1 large exoprotein [Microbacterium sp. VKM Ac-2923]